MDRKGDRKGHRKAGEEYGVFPSLHHWEPLGCLYICICHSTKQKPWK